MKKASKKTPAKKLDYEPNKMTFAVAALGGVAVVLMAVMMLQ